MITNYKMYPPFFQFYRTFVTVTLVIFIKYFSLKGINIETRFYAVTLWTHLLLSQQLHFHFLEISMWQKCLYQTLKNYFYSLSNKGIICASIKAFHVVLRGFFVQQHVWHFWRIMVHWPVCNYFRVKVKAIYIRKIK